MALYRYIVTQSDKEFVLENEFGTDAVAYGEGVRFAAELLAEHASPGSAPVSFRLVVQTAEGRDMWRVDIRAPALPVIIR